VAHTMRWMGRDMGRPFEGAPAASVDEVVRRYSKARTTPGWRDFRRKE
jgi:hypothetical protein